MAEFYVKVETDADAFAIDLDGTYPRVHVTAPPSGGRANAELTRDLSDLLGEEVRIVSGHRSTRKKLAVDLPQDTVDERLREAA